jgi:hypothetical protein
MRKIKFLILSLVAVALFSCEPTYVKEYNWAYPVAGDWTLTAYVGANAVSSPFEFKTYNSSFGKDSIWLDDYATTSSNGNFWSFKVKVGVDMKTNTFGTDTIVGSTNAITKYNIKIKVKNGKIIGTDSLSMDVIFGDDPTTTYRIAGHRLTSYEEYMQQ